MPIADTKFLELPPNGTLCPISPTKLPPYSPLIIFPYPLPDPYTSSSLFPSASLFLVPISKYMYTPAQEPGCKIILN